MGFALPFHLPFRYSPPVAALDEVYDCAINGRPYRFDRQHEAYLQGFRSLALLREQADDSAAPGEQSINREDLWRFGQSSWHKGAGQRWRDKEESDPYRFWDSKGVDVWTKDQLSLLPGTESALATAATTPKLVSAGGWLYVSTGTSVSRSNDGVTWTDIPFAAPTGTVTSLATNGFTVWATTPSQTYSTNTDTTTWSNWLTQPTTGSYELVAYVRGRVLVTNNQFVGEVTGTNTVTVLNPSEGNTAWRWTTITEGNNAIYAAGYSGNRSVIYRITPPPDTPSAALGVPVPAAPPLPSGEVVHATYGYLGLLAIGTSKGVRVAEVSGDGFLSIGALIATNSTVSCFEGIGQYAYFGWSAFDDVSTGLGRLDLSQQVDVSVYAYASDLMTSGGGDVTSIASFGDRIYFAVSGTGVFRETTTFVSSGWLDSGRIRYGVIDPKVAERVEIRHQSLTGSVGVKLGVDDDDPVLLGVSDLEGTVTPTIAFKANQATGNNFTVVTELESSATGSPVVQHVELRSFAAPTRGIAILVPLLLSNEYPGRTASDDFDDLVATASYRHTVTYQEKSKVWETAVLDFQFERSHDSQDSRFSDGTFVFRLLVPAQ